MAAGMGSVIEIPLENKELMDSPRRDNQYFQYYLRLEIMWKLHLCSKNRTQGGQPMSCGIGSVMEAPLYKEGHKNRWMAKGQPRYWPTLYEIGDSMGLHLLQVIHLQMWME
jgi:hypothetical protein